MSDFSNSIQEKAFDLGFNLFGITDPSPPVHYALYEYWLSQKHFGEMDYLDNQRSRELRKTPILLMPDCKSIIIVGLPNNPESFGKIELYGKIASFGHQEDYHLVIRKNLNQLHEFIKEAVGLEVKGKVFCDSSPLLEKELAQRAGLGWIGKNSLLISPQVGSLFNLGELFLDIDLPHSQTKNIDLCGDCQACIDACPMQCIKVDRTINAERCISYLTIEHKGIIDQSLRSKMGSWVFGCDICQMVCPWNKKPFSHYEISKSSQIFQLLKDNGFTNDQFLSIFGNTPTKRIKREGFLRNYSLSLGNSTMSEVIPVLEFLFSEKDPVIRRYVSWALGKIKNSEIRNILENYLFSEKDLTVINEINQALLGFD
jgi:epoxyqueuosine reductase